MTAPTVASVWFDASGRTVDVDLLEWAPDVFAFTEILLQRSEAYRFAVSPPPGSRWPPSDMPGWGDAVAGAAQAWCARAVDGGLALPELIAEEWSVVRDGDSTLLEDVATGRAWRLCQALLTLHAVADEACAGMGVAVAAAGGGNPRHRARGKELLTRTGSLARIPRDRLRVLPKSRTPAGGISFRALSRYVCLREPGVDVTWHRAPVRDIGASQHANILLLPWPLRIRERDFKPLPATVRRPENEPFGFFSFAPAEELDVDLVDRVLTAARDEVDSVDVVVLPESSVPVDVIDELESVLQRHGVAVLIGGVREPPGERGDLPANWVHLGVFLGGRWWHYRQNKHHRWFLDGSQIDQYHLGGALHPTVRWWEAMAVPRRSVNVMELSGGMALVAVICEDLARLDEVADLLRAVGPTLVVTILLDGPQLASRWTARYASILADDPGSAVLTLSAYGLVQRSRPRGRPPAPVVALWKDATRGLREIELDSRSHGVVVTVAIGRARRRAADGRTPIDNVAELFVAGVHQVRAVDASPAPPPPDALPARASVTLEAAELTILATWCDAVAEAITVAPGELDAVLSDAAPGATWRAALGTPEPSPTLVRALDGLGQVGRAGSGGGTAPSSATDVLAVVGEALSSEDELTVLAARVLSAALESRLSWLSAPQR